MSLYKKLLLCFACLLVVIALQTVGLLHTLNVLKSTFVQSVDVTTSLIAFEGSLVSDLASMRSQDRTLALYSITGDQEQQKAAQERFDGYLRDAEKQVQAIEQLTADPRVQAEVRAFPGQMNEIMGEHRKVLQLCKEGHGDEAAILLSKTGKSLYDDAINTMHRVQELTRGQLEDDKQSNAKAVARSYWLSLLVALAAIIIGLIVCTFLVQMNRTLHKLANDLNEGADQVAGAAAQVSFASQDLAQGASEQSASIQETSSSVSQVNAVTQQNAQNSASAATFSQQADAEIVQANARLAEMVLSMKEINSASEQISKIIKVIEEIAFQTNILALNAAVEAARAGEAGMGFAVVADEVRNLAQRCSQAAKDTSHLIENSVQTTAAGSRRLTEVEAAIKSVTESSARVAELIEEVHLGSQEQARSLEQIAHSITQMEQVVQKNAAGAEESAAAGEELSAQSEALKELTAHLASFVDGAKNSSAVSVQAHMWARQKPASVGRSNKDFNSTPEARSKAVKGDWLIDQDMAAAGVLSNQFEAF
jgi:methyl-accepting chemotaxis protein